MEFVRFGRWGEEEYRGCSDAYNKYNKYDKESSKRVSDWMSEPGIVVELQHNL